MDVKTLMFISLFLLVGCQNSKKPLEKEIWIDKPISEWPDFALTNSIKFSDTSYKDIANSFLINTGYDTVAATCKHLFMVFRNNGLTHIDLGTTFVNWTTYPKGKKDKSIELGELINRNNQEEIGEFNTLKVRDWIIFKPRDNDEEIYPLKLRLRRLEKNEIVYAIGWAFSQNTKKPAKIKLQIYRNLGEYCYVKTLTQNADPRGRSGSPIIDSNGYLVGLVSGAEGNLGVISTTDYLVELFQKYNIQYLK